MWKKAGWLYLGLYILGIVAVTIYTMLKPSPDGAVDPISSIFFVVLMLIPASGLFLVLKEKRVPILLTIISLLIIIVPVLAIFKFNELNMETIGKALLFVPMIAGLLFPAYGRLSKNLKKF
jgi:hypothetical protein